MSIAFTTVSLITRRAAASERDYHNFCTYYKLMLLSSVEIQATSIVL